ncbi:hypothetical protein WISP_92138 [Willisornis vidua]|uniref:Uncharacterized protein n=1 Tax=Willisornis vidua TaxID=1566151 RepID=A0ABQ9D192_9PASS|nr:hypothetical protein WISP_92138 [Willisornis vidua]
METAQVFPVLKTPKLDVALRVESHQSRVEGQNHLPRPAAHTSFDAALDKFGFLGCKSTEPVHVQPPTHNISKSFSTTLHLFNSQPILILGIALTQVQHLAFDLEISNDPLLKLFQVPLDATPSFTYVNHTTQLGIICKLTEAALDPFIYVINEDI